MSSLVSDHQHTSLGGRLPAYDGRKILYTAGELPFNSKEFEVTLCDNKIGSSGPRYVTVGRSFFSWKIEKPTKLGLDVSSTAFVQAMPLIDFVGEILNRNGVINGITDFDYVKVCNIVLGQRYQKKLDETQVTNMMAITCKRPSERETSIHKIVQNNNYNSAKRANEFGIEVDYNPTSVLARILTAPVLKYYGSDSNKCVPNNGKWNMIGKSFQVGNPKIFYVRPDQVEAALQKICLQARAVQKIDLLLALLPDKNGSLYGDIKRICEIDIGVMSQCCLRKNVLKSSPQCLANVALKINAKCGGRNSVFADIPASLPVVSNKPTIIFGADVTHPNALDDSAPSIASVVASQDWPEVTKYHGDVHAQGHREELIQGLEDIVKKLLLSFQRESKQRPQQLIFYRDGVSEGQFRQVLEKEIPEIEKAWKSLYNEKAPITFIVVQKRHHTRLFPSDSNQDTGGNVLPGTVVDTKICHPTEFDFFLCSHAGIKGTSRPTHYHILRDDNKFTADALQSLTNNLCYTYASCTRSVSTGMALLSVSCLILDRL
ncbi:hypothetical protein ACQ4PT_033880 [Festuca glaucescens]